MRTVVLSSNDNENYIRYLPYVQKAWNKLGWHTITFYLGKKEMESTSSNIIIKICKSFIYRDETIVQMSRLFAACISDEYLMTSDIDMLPLSNHWNPDEKTITTWGRDLTNYGHYPICYIGMPSEKWREVMGIEKTDDVLDCIEKLLINYPKALSNKWEEWWQVDQDIITEKLLPLNPIVIERGTNRWGLALLRADRANWEATKIFPELIDAHLPRPFDEKKIIELINSNMINLNEEHEWRFRNSDGILLPYYTKSFLDVLETWDLSEKEIFEYGGGSSTIYYAQKCNSVIVAEENKDYADTIERYKLPNVSVSYRTNALEYVNCIYYWNKRFDIIIVDSINSRDECIHAAINCMKDNGIIIIDNWMQPSVWMASEETQKLVLGYEYYIFKQEGHPDWQTLYAIIK